MELLTYVALTLSAASTASAASCAAGGLLGIGAGISTLPSTFGLVARSFDGQMLTVVQPTLPNEGTFLFPLALAPDNTTTVNDASAPSFTLQGGSAYAMGGTVLATQEIPLLGPEPLFTGADGSQHQELFNAVNASCDGTPQLVLRFTNLLPLPIASAVTNGTFGPNVGLASPILDNILTLGTPVDLIIVPNSKS